MSEDRVAALEAKLAQLEIEHSDLDASILALQLQAHVDQIRLQRLKKRKLALKDQIAKLRSELMPDLPAMAEYLPGFDVTIWYGFAAPARTPPARVQRLSEAVQASAAAPRA